MSTLKIPTAKVFRPLIPPARYKAAHGGRGSGKSHFFADLKIEEHLAIPGLRSVCVREVQKSLKESAKRLIEDKLSEFRLGEADGFKIFREVIQTPGDGLIIFQGMQDHTSDSIKSLEGFDRAWVEEAHTLSVFSLQLLRPTIRRPGSELHFSWNPRRKTDPVDAMLRGAHPPTGSVMVSANYSDNPWFPTVLEAERLDCLTATPDQYAHIWEGSYASVMSGAYFATQLALARKENRIGRVAADPLIPLKAYWDIGFSDATSIWIAQFIGREIRVLDYYEAERQPLASHINWLRDNDYARAECILPHDGSSHDAVSGLKFEQHIRQAGFKARSIPNMGQGAAMKRIEIVRRLFPSMWFNETTVQGGIEALGSYHERRDATRNIGLGPEHDWASHGADAFGLMAVDYDEPKIKRPASQRDAGGSSAWMG